MLSHGLFDNISPPSAPQLLAWLKNNDVEVNPGVEIKPTGDGWGLFSTQPLDLGQTSMPPSNLLTAVCKIPKSSLLSIRNSSLQADPSNPILALALTLLHEIRLQTTSKHWGYIQSLPRNITTPPLWPLCNEDERLALPWLKGTEAERDMARRERDGLSLSSLREYYASHPLPPTSYFPDPSPFKSFAHCYALVSTRAFIIDMYHLVALAPFADILNHSSNAHTSLASDDFVCHVCGRLGECEHDMPYPGRPPARLEHVDPIARARLGDVVDTVDMYVEVPVGAGEEILNCYGEMGDARLLVEWGFVPEDGGEGEVCTFDLGEGNGDGDGEGAERLEVEEDEEALLFNSEKASINHSGQVSATLFRAVYGGKDVVGDVRRLEEAWRDVQAEMDVVLAPELRSTARRVCEILRERLKSMHRPVLGVSELYDLRMTLGEEQRCQAMALTVAMDERAVLSSTLERWEALLAEHEVDTLDT